MGHGRRPGRHGLRPGPGFATIAVDATRDVRNVWWAFIKRDVSAALDLARLPEPGFELRVEARIRTDHAPRRVNLHLNTQKTKDFHSHLMEYDLAEAGRWTTISLTTRGFEAEPGDTVNVQMALMDWGLGRYRVDVDYFKVDVVEAAQSGPDLGPPIPYHPPVADPASFANAVADVTADLTVDLGEPAVNLNDWTIRDGAGEAAVVSAGGTRLVLLRWDFGRFAGTEGRRTGPPRADDARPRACGGRASRFRPAPGRRGPRRRSRLGRKNGLMGLDLPRCAARARVEPATGHRSARRRPGTAARPT